MANGNTPATLLDQEPNSGVKEVALVPAESANLVLMFERLAKDPAVDPVKLEKLIDLQERIVKHNAEQAFWEALSEMQGELPTIAEDGSIVVNGVTRSRYSTNENIQECIRPILKKHGFALSFRNATTSTVVKVTGILAHRAGHKETDDFESKPDDGGSMNSIQRIGSTRSYGQRYTTIALLNIVSRAKQDRDDDGNQSGRPEPPDGLEAWWGVMEGLAAEGLAKLEEAWAKSRPEFKTYVMNHNRQAWTELKAKAQKRGRS